MNQSRVLDELTAAPRYQAWLASLASPYLGDDPSSWAPATATMPHCGWTRDCPASP